MKTANNSVRDLLGVLIQNRNTLQGYPQTEEIQQTVAITEMRIESGIKFLSPLIRN